MIEKREIWFRGKSSATKEWVYGYFYKKKFYRSDAALSSYISIPHPGLNKLPSDHFLVIPETVGQFTGLFDGTKWEQLTKEEQSEWRKKHTIDEWNGRMIFEGDILEFSDRLAVVTWHEFCACWDCTFLKYINGMGSITNDRKANKWHENAIVIGNIYDNPELLKEGT